MVLGNSLYYQNVVPAVLNYGAKNNNVNLVYNKGSYGLDLVFLLLFRIGINELDSLCLRSFLYAFCIACAPFAFCPNLGKAYDNAFFCFLFWLRMGLCPAAKKCKAKTA